VSDTTLILLGAGNSTRFGLEVKKQWLYSDSLPLWLQVTQQFERVHDFYDIIVVSSLREIEAMQHFARYTFVEGGNTRQASLQHALKHVKSSYVLVSDIARCCIDDAMVHRILEAKGKSASVVPVLSMVDTLYYEQQPLDRSKAYTIQTPQLSQTSILKEALQSTQAFTDESSAIAALGESVTFVEGSTIAHKLTHASDITKLPCINPPSQKRLVGFGVDIHPFEEGKPMKLCGVTIDAPFGFKAHSDGDVAIHALIDALLGAAGLGDIGELYPDTDASYSNADSYSLLVDVVERIRAFGFDIENVDITIMAEVPKVSPYKKAMKERVSTALKLPKQFVNIKATTAEKLGFVGRKEGVKVYAVANLCYYNWPQEIEKKLTNESHL
jgi:2-C-methyl-D-erythritol 4-phosphate cytidylyltransferase/2-C-methyl-D-erythritol 2,4-cyclodiphosphate synthase